MDVNLSIKAVPQELAERLRRRAERHHRSLQGELMVIIEAAAAEEVDAGAGSSVGQSTSTGTGTGTSTGAVAIGRSEAPRAAAPNAAAPSPASPGTQVQGWKTVEQLLAERRARGWKPHPSLAGTPQAVDIIRADRDSR